MLKEKKRKAGSLWRYTFLPVILMMLLPVFSTRAAAESSDYAFTKQPTQNEFNGSWIDFQLNFTPVGRTTEMRTSTGELINAEGFVSRGFVDLSQQHTYCRVRAYYGKGKNDYVESDIFYVDFKFTERPHRVGEEFMWKCFG